MNLKYMLSVVPVLFSMSCATTRVFPITDGNYKIVISSATESAGYDKALSDIKSYCSNLGLEYEVINDKAEYVGTDKSTKAEVGASDDLSRDVLEFPHAQSMDRNDDNRVTMTFRCKTARVSS